jgi:glycosyltransferase involved in cell wall biosynthesis
VRIGLNATCFNDRPSGAKQRFVGIYGALIRRCPDIEFLIYEPRDCAVASWFAGAGNVRSVRTPMLSDSRWRRFLRGLLYWRSRLARDKIDLFETFHLPLVRAPHCPTIVTIHDARPILPGIPTLPRLIAGVILRRALRDADQVITVSNAMKAELLAIDPRATITSIYNGVDAKQWSQDNLKLMRTTGQRLRLPRDFILAVGHIEKRKNYARLVEAIAMLGETHLGLALVIVGNDGGDQCALANEIEHRGLLERVLLLQNVSDDDLASIYRLSRLVVFPSCYEGFGIPILEAMATKRPLVVSDIPVFVELTEGNGCYFPPSDTAAMADAIGSVLDNPERQNELVSYGSMRVRAFGFDQLAEQVEHVYRSILVPRRHCQRPGYFIDD